MGRNLEPKCKQCRRLGEKLFLKGERCTTAKCGMVKRNFPPGFHGPKGRKRVSGYGLQLAEKQKAKKFYNLMEKQFKATFLAAQKKPGDAGKNFFRLLEMRLDNVVYRLGIAASRTQARQLVNHGHFTINARKACTPSMLVKVGDVIAIKKTSEKGRFFREGQQNKNIELPSWLNKEKDNSAKVLHEPSDNDLPQNFNAQIIIEHYSK